jgi:hypothetical protein
MDCKLHDEIFETHAKSLNWIQPLKIMQDFMEFDISIACSPNASPIPLVKDQPKNTLIIHTTDSHPSVVGTLH